MSRASLSLGHGDFDQLLDVLFKAKVSKYIDFLQNYDRLEIKNIKVTAHGTVRDPAFKLPWYERLFNRPEPYTPTAHFATSSFSANPEGFIWNYKNILSMIKATPDFGDCHVLIIEVGLKKTAQTSGDYQYLRNLKLTLTFFSDMTTAINGMQNLWNYRDTQDNRVKKSNANVGVTFSIDEPAKSFENLMAA